MQVTELCFECRSTPSLLPSPRPLPTLCPPPSSLSHCSPGLDTPSPPLPGPHRSPSPCHRHRRPKHMVVNIDLEARHWWCASAGVYGCLTKASCPPLSHCRLESPVHYLSHTSPVTLGPFFVGEELGAGSVYVNYFFITYYNV